VKNLPPHPKPIHFLSLPKLFSLTRRAGQGWMEDSVPRCSAALAYYTFLSLAPLLIISIALAGLVFGQDASESRILDELRSFVGADSTLAIQGMLKGAWQPGHGALATALGGLTLLLGSIGVLNELQSALNKIWGVHSTRSLRTLAIAQTRLLGFILGVGFLLLVSLIFSAATMAAGSVFSGDLSLSEIIRSVFDPAFEWLMLVLAFAAIYKWLPDAQVEWEDVWIGAALTALFFLLGKLGLSLYLAWSGLGSAYGVAGSLIVVLVWVYYSAMIFYFGAEFIKVFSMTYGSRR
jgi:membrane protein